MSNENKSRTLGMPYGTACGKLRKNILFSLLKKHNENTCVRCKEIIETVEDLSIEHIKPWENISADLFWCLENVAFSHLSCNVPHIRRGGEGHRKVGPEGTAWCHRCREFEPAANFYKRNQRWNGLVNHCIKSRYDRQVSVSE